jgi:uncharacterized protein (DUF2237 family)
MGIDAGVILAATHVSALEFARLEELRAHGLDG